MEYISIYDIQKELRYKDPRAAIKWCADHGVYLADRGKIPCAIKADFFEQVDKPFINELKVKYGQDWEAAYKYCKVGNITALHSLDENIKNRTTQTPTKIQSKSKYNSIFDQYEKTKAA